MGISNLISRFKDNRITEMTDILTFEIAIYNGMPFPMK